MSEWQTIETAPKDGTEFLAITKGGTGVPFFARWTVVRNGIRRGTSIIAKRNTAQAIHPTHWMPLPPPPEQS